MNGFQNQISDIRNFQKVYLYYPNTWRQNIGDLAPPGDKKFNWFLCSRYYYDDKRGVYVIEIPTKTFFYDPDTGNTLVVDEPQELMVIDSSLKDFSNLSFKVREHKLQGYVIKSPWCPDTDQSCMCHETTFYFLKNILRPILNENTCELISYSKRNYPAIYQLLPDFPSPKEIDRILESYPCSTVCQVLFQYIQRYLSKLSYKSTIS